MYEERETYKIKTRKLGDEWENWDGKIEEKHISTKASPNIFLVLLSISATLYIVFLWSIFKLLAINLDELSIYAMEFLELIVYTIMAITIIFYILFYLTIRYKKPLSFFLKDKHLPDLRITKFTIYLGNKFGIPYDKVLHSIIEANNILTRVLYKQIKKDDLLILVPRCLSKNTRHELEKLTSNYNLIFHIAAGGSQARKILKEHKPKGIVAVACERDLYAGVKDVPSSIPVLGIANSRPEGPCTNTVINMEELKSAIDFFIKQ